MKGNSETLNIPDGQLGISSVILKAANDGWETLKEVERYTIQANRKRLAAQVKKRIDG